MTPSAKAAAEKKRVVLAYCKGSNAGRAIYLERRWGTGGDGFRVAGPKCWGMIDVVEGFDLDENALKDMIRECQLSIAFLKAQQGKKATL